MLVHRTIKKVHQKAIELTQEDHDIPALHRLGEELDRQYAEALGDADDAKLLDLNIKIAALHVVLSTFSQR